MDKCLYCYRPLEKGETDFHHKCAKKFFGTEEVPVLDYTCEDLEKLAIQVIKDQTSLTGVQPKLSLHLNKYEGSQRLTIVGLWGSFICKPQTVQFKQMPETEDLTMHLAESAKIDVVPHTLMRMADNSLCYLTKRIDRSGTGEKVERQTEHKYKSSYERIAKAIVQYSSMPKMDVTNFFEVILFSWITGNNDMHLKNFSLYEPIDGIIRLTPAYDMLNAVILNPKDDEELALTLNGKKKKLERQDFILSGMTMGVGQKAIERLILKYAKLLPEMAEVIDRSFLTDEFKDKYYRMIHERIGRLNA